MSWSAPNCHHCHACVSTRFDRLLACGPSFGLTVRWICQVCHGHTFDLCTIGPDGARTSTRGREDAIELPSLEAAERESMQAYRLELLMLGAPVSAQVH